MRERVPETETINASEARQNFSSLLNRVYRDKTRVTVERSGIPIAVIVSPEDLERLDRYEAQRAERFKALDEFAAAFADVSVEELERETAKALAEVRAEMRAEREQAAAEQS